MMKPIALAVLLVACGGNNSDKDKKGDTDTVDVPACTVELAPGDDDQTTVQTALIDASEGEVICFEAGTFTFNTELSLSVDNVTLRGAGLDDTVLDFSTQDVGANGVAILSNGVIMEDIQVFDTPGDGVRAQDVQDIIFRRMSVVWPDLHGSENGAYGLYPVGSNGVRIEDSVVTGARDAGIYVGQSETILVRGNEVYANVAGIEIENSKNAEVTDNNVHDNTGGVFVFNLPNLPVQDGQATKVHANTIINNNVDNFAEPGTVVAGVPRGVGLFIIAADRTEVHDNEITGNKTAGLLVLGFTELAFPGEVVDDPAAYDRYSDNTYIHHNVFSNNGDDPVGEVALRVVSRPVPSVVTDGCPFDRDQKLCMFENGDAGFSDIDICGLFLNQTEDIATVTCEGEVLPTIDP